jgi:hypothetical protein
MHPLITDFETLKDNELESRVQSLTSKYYMTGNPALKQQIAMALDVYRIELSARRARQYQADYQKRDKDLDKLIKVN